MRGPGANRHSAAPTGRGVLKFGQAFGHRLDTGRRAPMDPLHVRFDSLLCDPIGHPIQEWPDESRVVLHEPGELGQPPRIRPGFQAFDRPARPRSGGAYGEGPRAGHGSGSGGSSQSTTISASGMRIMLGSFVPSDQVREGPPPPTATTAGAGGPRTSWAASVAVGGCPTIVAGQAAAVQGYSDSGDRPIRRFLRLFRGCQKFVWRSHCGLRTPLNEGLVGIVDLVLGQISWVKQSQWQA